MLELAQSPRSWHYGDSSPTLLQPVEAYVLNATRQIFSNTLHGINGTLNLLPKQASVSWLSEVMLLKQ